MMDTRRNRAQDWSSARAVSVGGTLAVATPGVVWLMLDAAILNGRGSLPLRANQRLQTRRAKHRHR